MHESSLARNILHAVLRRPEIGLSRVVRVTGWIAQDEALSPESLAFHFEAHARGTRAEGAKLDLALRHVPARCDACGATYAPEHHLLLCPSCGSTDGRLTGETGLGIESIDVEGGP